MFGPRIRHRRALAALIGLVGAAVSGCASHDGAKKTKATAKAAATAAPAPSGAAAAPAPPWLLEIEAEVEALRGRRFLRPVPYAAQTRASFQGYVRGELARELPPQKSSDSSRALVALGFVPEGFELRSAMEKAMVTQVAAYYDTKLRAFRVISAAKPGGATPARNIVAHELTHALADQHFDLETYAGERADSLDDDEKLARHCVVEGEATFLMNAVSLATGRGAAISLGPLAVAGLRVSIAMTSAMDLVGLLALSRGGREAKTMDAEEREELEALTTLPLVVTMPMVEPYFKGAALVSEVWGRGGWTAVDGLFRRAPQSTEQVLHPREKLLDERDPPIHVSLPAKPAPLPGPSGATRLVESNVIGELGWRVYLKTWKADDADGVAAGWGGDRYWVWERGAKVITAVATTWDSEADAKQFASAFASTLAARFPRAASRPGGPGGGLSLDVGAHRTISLAVRGRDVDVIDGADETEQASLRTALAAAARRPAISGDR